MTSQEFKQLIDEMETLWPNSQPWPAETVKLAFSAAQRLDAQDLATAVKRWFDAGHKWPPTPAELLAGAREQALLRLKSTPALETSRGLTMTGSEYVKSQGFNRWDELIAARIADG